MKNGLALIIAGVALASMSGCIVAPARGYGGGGEYVAPAGVVYVAPNYASPGDGLALGIPRDRYGWGWHHPQYGWHKGWH